MKLPTIFLFCFLMSQTTWSKVDIHTGQNFLNKNSTESSSCKLPYESKGMAVDTDGGGNKSGSKTYQSQTSFQNTFGGSPKLENFLGAVSTNPSDNLKGGDIICYTHKEKTVCGVVFDNAFTSSQMKKKQQARFKSGKLKPAEATAKLHKELGASYASGSGSSFSNSEIKATPVKLSEKQRKKVIEAVKTGNATGNYNYANSLAQEFGASSSCLGTSLPSPKKISLRSF